MRQEERIKFYNFGLYAQDAWVPRPNVTLTIALRVEHYSNPVCDGRCFTRLTAPFRLVSHDPAQPYTDVLVKDQERAFEQLDNLLWSPRFSFAWQPRGLSRSTVLRGGIGIFYDPIPGGLAYRLASNPPLLNSYSVVGDNLAPDETTSLSKDAADSNRAFLKGIAAGQTLAEIQSSVPDFSPPAITIPEKRLHFPQFQRWNLELQQAFGPRTSITVGYHGNHGIKELVSDPSANAFGFGPLPPALCSSPPIPPSHHAAIRECRRAQSRTTAIGAGLPRTTSVSINGGPRRAPPSPGSAAAAGPGSIRRLASRRFRRRAGRRVSA